MALFPVQGITEGDFVVHLVPIDTEDPMTVVAEKITHHAVGRRLPVTDRPTAVVHNGDTLPDDATVVTAGAAPLDVLEVVFR
jgi:toluene monooxygenase system protein B